jgi:hypothetical protein
MAEKLLRFKDVLNLEGIGPLENPKQKLSFDDMHVTQYRPGEDELTNYRAYRRRRVHDVGSDTATYSESVDPLQSDTDVDEALTVSQRLRKKQQLRRIMPKIKLGRERAKRRIASKEKLEKRARKKARNMILRKLTKDIPKSELTYARRQELEKRLDTPALKKRISNIARRMYPKVRQAELAKKRGGSK